MGYLQVLNLMVKAYKAARGVMPKGIDMLKLKMKARQKVIDSKKVIQFPPDRITNPFKARPQPPKIEIKGGIQTTRGMGDLFKKQLEKVTKRVRETDAQTIARMKKQNKESAQRLRDKKDLGDRLKDYKGDPDAMREGGLMGYAVGGRIQNLMNTYAISPSLQNQFADQQDYIDLFDLNTNEFTPTTQSAPASLNTSTPQGILTPNIVKPIIIPGSESDGGGEITNINRNKNFDYETKAYEINPTGLSKNVFDYEYEAANEDKGILQKLLDKSLVIQAFKKGKQGLQKVHQFGLDVAEDRRIKKELAEQEAARREFDRLNALRQLRDEQSMSGGPGETTQGTFGSSVNDASTFSDYS